MFDLEREVESWSTAVHGERCRPAAEVAELRDHLYCEIERGRAEGLSDEDAFRAAIARLGSAEALSAEHTKNRSLLGTVCQTAARLESSPKKPEHRQLLLANAVIWASLILGASLILSKSATPLVMQFLIVGVCGPLWFASDQLLRAAMRPRRA
jgi:hypothetical protein